MDSRKEPATSLADFLLLVQDHVLPVPIIPQGKLPKGMSEEAPLWPKKKMPKHLHIFYKNTGLFGKPLFDMPQYAVCFSSPPCANIPDNPPAYKMFSDS